MKRFILHTLLIAIAFLNGAFAQTFPKTYYSFPCVNCTPAGYSIETGGPVALSNMTGLGGSPTKPWLNSFLPPPSSNKAIDANDAKVFLTLRYGTVQKDKVKANVSGFEIGNKYTLHYYVMTSRVDLALGNSSYAASATVEVQTGSFAPVASKTTSFVPNVNVNKWVEETLTFTAPATDLVFYLSGLSNPQETAFVNFDIYSKPFNCVVPGGEVELFRSTLDTPFACATTNLYDLVKGSAPAATVPVWALNSNSSYPKLSEEEAKAASPKPAGQYYYAFYQTPGGCYNTEFSTAKVAFTSTPTQVSLLSNQKLINCINQTGVDLNAQVSQTPYKVHWFTNDKHQGIPFNNPQSAPVNTYFAFYFDSKNNCYSVDKAAVSAAFSVSASTMCCNDPNDPSNQVPLLNTDVKIVAPAQTYDLTKLIPANLTLPPNVVLEWYISANHSGSPLADPEHAGPGKYYVFAHDLSNGCFNVPLSKSSVNVAKNCNAGSTPVGIVDNSGNFYCEEGEPTITLNNYVVGSPPAGTSVVWFDNNSHSGASVTTGTVGQEYYAFYYDAINDCYNQAVSTAQLTINYASQVLISCPYEDGCELSTGCPKVGVSLNTFHDFAAPAGIELRWFNNPTHSGQYVEDPTKVTATGTYYAFYYHLGKQCYNRKEIYTYEQGGKGITVVNQPCPGPQLEIRVALQGAIETAPSDEIMRSDLQTYFGNSGLLPTISPYGDLATCSEINDATKMSKVVDWVKVEIRDAIDPSILLESKSLILWATGFVGNLDGTSDPSFTSQSKPVRIVIKHRNHLPVMSNTIQDFSSGIISYDFTDALSQASNEFGAPTQMVEKNGVWCMRPGDLNINQDFFVDGVDGSFFNVQFKGDIYNTYDRADINMDGFVDGVDGSLFNTSFYQDIYSTLIFYTN